MHSGLTVGSNRRLWDTATGQCLRTIIHEDHAPVVGVRFSPNGKYVLAWTLDSALRLWNYVDGRCVKTYQGHSNSKFSLGGAFGTYGSISHPFAFVASGSEDGSIWLWDVSTKSVLQRLDNAHDGAVFGVDTHPSDRFIVSGGADGLVRMWGCDEHTASSETEPILSNGDVDIKMED
jgi:COMPASS component SWD3